MVLLVKPGDHGLIDRHAFAGFSLHLMQHTGMCKMPGFLTAHHHQILQHFPLLLFQPGDWTSIVKVQVVYLVCHSSSVW